MMKKLILINIYYPDKALLQSKNSRKNQPVTQHSIHNENLLLRSINYYI